MGLMLYEARSGALRELKLNTPPRVLWFCAEGDPRARWAARVFEKVARYVGFSPECSASYAADLVIAACEPGGAGHWMQTGPETGEFGRWGVEVNFLRAKTHYRSALNLEAQALLAARSEYRYLLDMARPPSTGAGVGSARAIAAYTQRFREALKSDLNTPLALECLWDAARPGALSPASRSALLAEALPVLGLDGDSLLTSTPFPVTLPNEEAT